MSILNNTKLYWFGLRARPFAPMTTPKGHASTISTVQALTKFPQLTDKRAVRHGAISYTQPLSKEEVYNFELIPLNI